jgi:IclR family pca regulon transcriptional regulator
MPGEPGDGRDPDFVQSLDRGLAVIRAFDADRTELTLSEVARATNLTRAAARRFLHTLVALGYARTDGRVFTLRPRVLELGHPYLSTLGLPEAARPHMEELVDRVHESSSLSVLDGEDVRYIARVPGRQIMAVTISVGTRFPAYATSMGRVLLAHCDPAWLKDYLARVRMEPLTRHTVTDAQQLEAILARVRDDGHCLVDQELEEGLRSVAVPVRDASDAVVAAMNVSAHVSRGDPDALRAELLPLMREAARRIAEAPSGRRAPAATPAHHVARRPAGEDLDHPGGATP